LTVSTRAIEEALGVVASWEVEAAAAVFDTSGLLALAGPADAPRRWASVTKLVTALAVLVAVEEGTVELDMPAGPPGSTLRHLLAHASGLARDSDEVQAPAGTRRVYSNRGIEVAAETVAAAAGMPFADYLAAGVLEPLGLRATTLEGSPASGALGPLTDLVRLGGELFSPTLVSASTMATATSVTFPHLNGVLPGFGRQTPNDWGLGFEIRDGKAPHWTGSANSDATFGHFGLSGAFVWIDPVAGVGCAAVSAEDFGPWATRAWPALADAVLAAYAE
jgi:CubicO group peptidase (beta-lactamase class C family)